jgi:hypothetical protein
MRHDLSGPWQILHDPSDRGLVEGWFRSPPASGWRETTVPSAWQATLGVAAKGVAWYRRDLPASGRALLRFESVATACTAWVDGVEVGRHEGDFLPFDVEVPPGPAGRSLVVRVDQRHAPRPAAGVMTENGHLGKGFHDVLSVQHAGIWQPVFLREVGSLAFLPDGVHVVADAVLGRVTVRAELRRHQASGELVVEVDGRRVTAAVAPGQAEVELSVELDFWKVWSPDQPNLYTLRAALTEGGVGSDAEEVRFGFRTVAAGGEEGARILINGVPTLLRGVLHWGHEPRHIAPAPPPEEVRAQFARLRASGFNCVCLCMVYLPRHFYDIADETGMLLWQEHPFWKSDMAEENVPEYRRLSLGYFRRDRNHASIVIESGTCEHERFNPTFARWWWEESARQMPHCLRQVQTGFMAWCNPQQTDLHDEHVYENSGRWPAFLADVRAEIRRIGSKPFVMGETIIANAWPDVPALTRAAGEDPRVPEEAPGVDPRWAGVSPWYMTRGLRECAAVEGWVQDREGAEGLERFRRQAARFGYEFRRWQVEAFRLDPGNAGFVMNHIRDVPACRCGFMDDLDRWRYDPADLSRWLADTTLLLGRPQHRSAFAGPSAVPLDLTASNFGPVPVEGELTALLSGATWENGSRSLKDSLTVGLGSVAGRRHTMNVPPVDRPTEVSLTVSLKDVTRNRWSLWAFPASPDDPHLAGPPDTVRLDGLPFSKAEGEAEFEERGYSSGWGLKCATWQPSLPSLDRTIFKCPLWRFDSPMPVGTRLVVAHRLTRGLIEFMGAGGRVILLGSRAAGGMQARTVMLWGQVPFVAETGPLGPGDSDWVVDLLAYDLMLSSQRAIPVEDLGLHERVDPLVRLVFTHDSGKPRMFDALFQARVGSGALMVSTLDHTGPAGRHLLRRMMESILEDPAAIRGEVTREDLTRFAAT